MTLRALGVIVLATATLMSLAARASADVAPPPTPGGGVSPTGPGAGLGAPGGTPVPVGDPSPVPPPSNQSGYTWRFVSQDQSLWCTDTGATFPAGGTAAPGTGTLVGPNPFPDTYQMYDPSGNAVGPPKDVCPNAGSAAPPPPPPPPAPAEVVQFTPFPAETIHHSPCYLGLTGLRSDMWATVSNGPLAPVTATATIRGYTVTVTAHPVEYRWSMGNGNLVVGTQSGSRDNPSASYTYEQTGTFTVSLTVTWAGVYKFAGYGTAQTANLPEVAQAPPQQLPWPVQGVTSVLVAPGYGDTSTTLPPIPSAC